MPCSYPLAGQMDDAAKNLFGFGNSNVNAKQDAVVQPKKKAKAAPKPSAPPPPSSGPAATTASAPTAARGPQAEPKAKRSRRAAAKNNGADATTPSGPSSGGPSAEQDVPLTTPGTASATAAETPVQPKQEVPLISHAELIGLPADGGVAELTKKGSIKSGQGKRSAEEMRQEDNIFLAERRGELISVGDFTKVPAEETLAYCSAKGRVACGCASKCNVKVQSLKRRKDAPTTETEFECMRVHRTATIFHALYTHLSHESGNGAALADVLKMLEAEGYKFANVVHIKQVNGAVLELLRFGQLPRLVATFSSSSEAMVRLSALDVADSDGILEEVSQC